MRDAWYKKSYFRNLIDMHIANTDARLLADFDGEAYADRLASAGFDTAYIYASNCLGLCLYPTKTGVRHKATEGGRDLFGEAVSACKKRGLRAIGYLNSWSTAVDDAHPDWRTQGKDGKGHRDLPGHAGRYGVPCPNSPYRDYFLSLVREVCGGYPIDGLWVDMVGFWRGVCHCEGCRQKFLRETGLPLPERIDWDSPDWVKYISFKRRSLAFYAQAIEEAAKGENPALSVSIQSAGWRLGAYLGFGEEYFDTFDYAAGDFYTDVREGAVDAEFLRAVTKDTPFEYLVSRCPTLTYHTVSKPVSALRAQAFSAVLHDGAFLLIDAIDPKGTLDCRVYESFRAVGDALRPYADHPAFLRGERYAEVALYVNYDSAFDPAQNGTPTENGAPAPLFARLSTMVTTLAARHVPYTLLSRRSLSSLEKYPVIVLSELYALTREELSAFDAYVKGGGRLYVSGRSGSYLAATDLKDEKTLLLKDSSLRHLTGVSFAGTLPYDTCYLRMRGEEENEHPLGAKAKGAPLVKREEDTRVLAYATLPFSNHTDNRRFLSAISDPPWEKTDISVLTEHSYGRGRCLYSALLLEGEKTDALKDLWVELLLSLLGEGHLISISAPEAVESTVKWVDGKLVLTLQNTLWAKTEAPAGETEVKISKKLFSPSRVSVFPSGDARLFHEGESVCVSLSHLPELSMITLD